MWEMKFYFFPQSRGRLSKLFDFLAHLELKKIELTVFGLKAVLKACFATVMYRLNGMLINHYLKLKSTWNTFC